MKLELLDSELREIRQRFEAGESKTSISKATGLSLFTVSKYLPQTKPRISDAEIREMTELVKSGKTKIEVAELLGRHLGTIHVHTRHLKRNTADGLSREIKVDIKNKLSAGETVSAIARDLNLTYSIVRAIKSSTFANFLLTEMQTKAIRAERALGKNFYEIAASLEIPITEVYRFFGFNSGVRYDSNTRFTAISAIDAGESINKVSQRMGISQATVHKWYVAAVNAGEVSKPQPVLEKRDDYQFTWISRNDSQLEEWRQLVVSWFEAENPPLSTVIGAITTFIDKYIVGLSLPKVPSELLRRGRSLPDFYDKCCIKSQGGRSNSMTVFRLVEWVLESPGFADCIDGEPIRAVDVFRNPITPRTGTSDDAPRNSESSKVVLPYFLVADLRRRLAQGPNFTDWIWIQSLGGLETINGRHRSGDWFVVDKSRIDESDKDCVWRLRRRESKPPVLEMWSPVRWVHALIHLQTTTRGGQLRMVDSGEADTFIWTEGNFVPNTDSLKHGTARHPHQQGIFRRPAPVDISQGARVFLYFNSNKTGDRNASGSSLGFVCPWPEMPSFEEDPYYWLAKLRNWQRKYNPISSLTAWKDLKGAAKLSAMNADRLLKYPDTAFLFRAPENSDPTWPIYNNQCNTAWHKLIRAFEDCLNAEGIKHPSGEPIELINPENGLAWSTQHATRVSLITHLIVDGDVPPIMMMKIAGHARFIMTIYYTKVGLASIQDAIKTGSEKIESTKHQTFERDLLSATSEQMRDTAVFNARDWKTVIPINPADRNPLGWLHLHDGICLAGGNTHGDSSTPGCHNGGPTLLSFTKKGKPIHGPVAGGVRNCCRCRWKAAGKQHVFGLAATYDNRAYHMHNAKSEAIAAERGRNLLLQEKAGTESTGMPFLRLRDLIQAERLHESAMQRFQELALDVVELNRTIERVVALPDLPGGPTALAAQGDMVALNMIVEETSSELLQLAGICAGVEFYPDLDAGTAVFEFAQLLDYAFEREGQPMVLSRLSENEKLVAANAIMRELEKKVNPEDPLLGRRKIVEILDRGESLERMLGIDLKHVLQESTTALSKPIALRLNASL